MHAQSGVLVSSISDLMRDSKRAMSRPKGIVLIIAVATCVAAVLWLVPSDQYALALIVGLGIGAFLAVLMWHNQQLTRWVRYLEQNLRGTGLEAQRISKSITRLEAYTHAADLNVGRIAALQAKLLEANSRPGSLSSSADSTGPE